MSPIFHERHADPYFGDLSWDHSSDIESPLYDTNQVDYDFQGEQLINDEAHNLAMNVASSVLNDTDESLDDVFGEQENFFTGIPSQIVPGRVYRLNSGLRIPVQNQHIQTRRVERLSSELFTPLDHQLRSTVTRTANKKRLLNTTKSNGQPNRKTRRKRKMPFISWFIRKMTIKRNPESDGWFIKKFSFWKQNHPDDEEAQGEEKESSITQ